MNVFICHNNKGALLEIDSLDSDTADRTVSPLIWVSSLSYPEKSNIVYSNVLNSYMDSNWDGFYTSQKRLSRFPGIIGTSGAVDVFYTYNITYSGTPP
jgi:hypothetical protein